jgi:hypothetical protein
MTTATSSNATMRLRSCRRKTTTGETGGVTRNAFGPHRSSLLVASASVKPAGLEPRLVSTAGAVSACHAMECVRIRLARRQAHRAAGALPRR